MTQSKWSESEIIAVFEKLGLQSLSHKNQSQLANQQKESLIQESPIYISRLSDSSVPPPSGRIIDAKLERTAQ